MRPLGIACLAILAASAVVTAVPASASSATVVETARNAKLHKRILVNRRGLSLYSLSAERRGRFICTDRECLSLWKPLLASGDGRPRGVRSLGTIERPDERTQVTYRGRPLYTFDLDRRKGDVRGEGFRDVGVWHAAAAPRR